MDATRQELALARVALAAYAVVPDDTNGEVAYERARRAAVVRELEAYVAAAEVLTARERVRAHLWLSFRGRPGLATDILADFETALADAYAAGQRALT